MRNFAFLAIFLVGATTAHAQSAFFEDSVVAVGRFFEDPQHEKLLGVMAEVDWTPTAFETDGCSGGMSAAWAPVAGILPSLAEEYQDAPPWESCCIIHDRAYHNSGKAEDASESFNARLAADVALMQCVLKDGEERREAIANEFSSQPDVVDKAYSVIANGMFSAVRLGGGPCSGLSWRWGYGYPTCFWK